MTDFIQAIDWGTFPDWVVAFAAAAAAWQGWRSLSNWRKEAGGRRRLELAEEVLVKVYEVADALAEVRNPFGHLDENMDREGRANEEKRLQEYRDMYYPIFSRLGRHRGTVVSLRALRFRSRAIFGDGFQDALDQITVLYDEVAKAVAELYYDLPWDGEQTEERFQRHVQLREIIWSSSDDKFSSELNDRVTAIEKTLRPIIRRFVG